MDICEKSHPEGTESNVLGNAEEMKEEILKVGLVEAQTVKGEKLIDKG